MLEEDKEYEVFYDRGEIDEVKEFQTKDIFNAIFRSKEEIREDNGGMDNLKRQTRITIEDWAPGRGGRAAVGNQLNRSHSSGEEECDPAAKHKAAAAAFEERRRQ